MRFQKRGCLLREKAHVLDFWSWAFSDLRKNNVRGHLAEYIVGLALGVPLTVRSSWDDYDLLVPAGTVARGPVRLQVKSAAYLQAWGQRKLSAITFGGLRRRPFPWSADQGFVLGETKCPKADVFVFAIETARRHDDYDPSGDQSVGVSSAARASDQTGHTLPRNTLQVGLGGYL